MPIHNPFGRRVGYDARSFNPFSAPVRLNAPFYSPYQQRQLLPERYEEKIHGDAPEVIQEVIDNAPPQEIQQVQQRAESEGRSVHEQIALELVNEAKTKNKKWGKYSREWEFSLENGIIGNVLGAFASAFGEERPNDWLTEAGISADEYLAAQDVIDYAPTGITGTQRGDYSGATGGLFSSAGVATDPTTGFALEDSSGSDVYSSWSDWGNVIEAGSASGWRGGFLTERQYSQLSPVGRANYENFIDTYNDQQGTNLTGGIPGGTAAQRQAEIERQEASRRAAEAEAARLAAEQAAAAQAAAQQQSDDRDPFGTGRTYDSAIVQREAARTQDAYEEAAYGGSRDSGGGSSGGGRQGNREGSGYGGQAQSGEYVSRDHDWSAARNKGGLIMYRQTGGPIADDGTVGGQPVGMPSPGGQVPPQQSLIAPEAPMAPAPQMPMMMPEEEPEESFFDKFQKARKRVKGKTETTMLIMEEPMAAPMVDMQGDGPVYGDVTMAPDMVGPDMGPDTVDTKLTPGEFVMNAEATEMFRPEIEEMNQQGLIARQMGGPIYRNEGGMTYERQAFIRRMLETVKPGSLDEKILLKKLGIDPVSRKNMGGLIYRQPGGEIPQQQPQGLIQRANQFAANPAVGQLGEFLYKSAYHDPSAIDAFSTDAEASDANVGTKTWMDQDTKLKYKEVTLNGRTQYIGIHDNKPLTDQGAISRLVLVGTEGSGAAKPEAPEKLLPKQTSDRFMLALGDAKKAIIAGGGDIIDLINRRSVTLTEYAKIAAAAKVAGGSDEIFKVLNTVLGKAIVQAQPRPSLVAFYDFLHSVSQFEVIASQASGETRLTDEDAKRYLRAIVDPEAAPESILTQLGRAYFDVMKETQRTALWNEWAATAPGTQRTEYYFNQNVWNQKSAELDNRRNEIIQEFIGEGWKPSEKSGAGEQETGVTLEGLPGQWFEIESDVVPEYVQQFYKAENEGKEIDGQDGKFYVFTATIASALGYAAITPGTTQWYVREGGQ